MASFLFTQSPLRYPSLNNTGRESADHLIRFPRTLSIHPPFHYQSPIDYILASPNPYAHPLPFMAHSLQPASYPTSVPVPMPSRTPNHPWMNFGPSRRYDQSTVYIFTPLDTEPIASSILASLISEADYRSTEAGGCKGVPGMAKMSWNLVRPRIELLKSYV
ncbi:hypothetical protein J008_03117 [Cryptococcus neoformans]|nr:hypothetical protein J008_03117 [Cryptococcus neoformans var. grubii]